MVGRFLFALTGRLPCRLIDIEGAPYLERYYVGQVIGTTFYLHRFVGADGDRQVHDHPWRFAFAVVLCGWYTEERMQCLDIAQGWQSKFRVLRPGRLNWLGPRSFHMITEARPNTWTLFVHGKRCKTWGFLTRTEGANAAASVVYHQPYDVRSQRRWWERVGTGCEVNRVPL